MLRAAAAPCCLSLPLVGCGAGGFPDPHAGFFMEALKGRRLRSARPYRLNSFLPLQARAVQPRPGGSTQARANSQPGSPCLQLHAPHCSPTHPIAAACLQTQRYSKLQLHF